MQDWDDLWRPELTGKISMVDSPREVVGAVLKRMGASYNTKDVDLQVIGGRESALHNLISLQKQVRIEERYDLFITAIILLLGIHIHSTQLLYIYISNT